jgi:hypothetical protein
MGPQPGIDHRHHHALSGRDLAARHIPGPRQIGATLASRSRRLQVPLARVVERVVRYQLRLDARVDLGVFDQRVTLQLFDQLLHLARAQPAIGQHDMQLGADRALQHQLHRGPPRLAGGQALRQVADGQLCRPGRQLGVDTGSTRLELDQQASLGSGLGRLGRRQQRGVASLGQGFGRLQAGRRQRASLDRQRQ